VYPFPEAALSDLVCELLFSIAERPAPALPLVEQIARRVTNRRLGPPSSIAPQQKEALSAAAAQAGARLQWVTSPASLEELGGIVGVGERLVWLSRAGNEELSLELRWTEEEARSKRDGIDVATLEMTEAELLLLKTMSSWPAMELVGGAGSGRALGARTRQSVRTAAGVALLTMRGEGREAYFQGGRAAQRVWLTATSLGLAVQPVGDLVSLFARLEQGGGEGLHEGEVRALYDLRGRYRGLFDVLPGETEIMLLRVHYADAPAVRSLRKSVWEVLAFEDARGKRLRPLAPERPR
jgi:hypothetical protein